MALFTEKHNPGPKTHKHRQSRRKRDRNSGQKPTPFTALLLTRLLTRVDLVDKKIRPSYFTELCAEQTRGEERRNSRLLLTPAFCGSRSHTSTPRCEWLVRLWGGWVGRFIFYFWISRPIAIVSGLSRGCELCECCIQSFILCRCRVCVYPAQARGR